MSAAPPRVLGHGLLMPTPGLPAAPALEHVTDYKNRAAWLQARQRGIGASEAAALFDLSPWDSRHSLWLKKTGRLSPELLEAVNDSDATEAGRIFEAPIATLYERRTGRALWAASDFCIAQHPRIPSMFATLDRFIIDAPDRPGQTGLAQIKLRVGADWSDGPPLHVQCQIQQELAVTGRDFGSAVLLEHGCRLRHWDVERQPDFIARLEEENQIFWGFVERREPPPLDGHKATLDAIKRLHPSDNGQTVELAPEASHWLEAWLAAKAAVKAAETTENELEAKLREAIGDATFGRLVDGRLLKLGTTSRGAYTVEPCSYRQLRIVNEKPKAAPKARKPARKSS